MNWNFWNPIVNYGWKKLDKEGGNAGTAWYSPMQEILLEYMESDTERARESKQRSLLAL